MQWSLAARRPCRRCGSLHTPEGKRYNAVFADKIQTWMQPCLQEASNDVRNFNLLLKVSKEGAIEDLSGGGNPSSLTQCLGHELLQFKVSKQAVLPPPPQPDYWVRFDFNPEHAAAAELK